MFSKYEGIADITLLSRNMLGKSKHSNCGIPESCASLKFVSRFQ